MNHTDDLKTLAIHMGVDLIGIASVDRFENAPNEGKPQYYMHDAKSVVVIGSRVLETMCNVHGSYEELGKTIGPYIWYGYAVMNWSLSWIAIQLSKTLEEKGYKALPFPPTGFIYRDSQKGLPDFYHKHAAVAAGLGEFGLNGLLLTPQFGARQRIVSIITNAPLEPDPMYNGSRLCNPKECNNTCIKICPMKAFDNKNISVNIGGKIYEYRVLDSLLCRWTSIGGKYLRGIEGFPRYPNRKQIDELITNNGGMAKIIERLNSTDKKLQQFTFAPTCGACMTKCRAPWK